MFGLSRCLEKQGMTLSYMKNIIRNARAKGIGVFRKPEQLMGPAKGILENAGSKPTRAAIKGKVRDMQDWGAHSYIDTTGTKPITHVYVPKGYELWRGPRATLLHELGHAEHGIEDNVAHVFLPDTGLISDVAKRQRKNLLETIGNNNAILGMQKAKVPDHLIEHYKQETVSPFRTYQNSLIDTVKEHRGYPNPKGLGYDSLSTHDVLTDGHPALDGFNKPYSI